MDSAHNKTKRRILICADWYSPGYKAGGVIRTMVNLTSGLQKAYDFFVITGDRDLADTVPYPGIETNTWIDAATSKVWYAAQDSLSISRYKQILALINPDILLLNGTFSFRFVICPLLVRNFFKPRLPVILLPHGMLRNSALKFKQTKKNIFFRIAKTVNLYKNLFFLCSSKDEASDVIRMFGPNANTRVIPHFLGPVVNEPKTITKEVGSVKFIFIGRIHPIKNLHFLLEALKDINGDVTLSVVGNIEDDAYWLKCEAIIKRLNGTVKVQLLKEMPPEELQQAVDSHHFLTLPTTGENFGYAIFESLASGRPVIISDQTPWRNLKVGNAGMDVTITDGKAFTDSLREAIQMDQELYNKWSVSSADFARRFLTSSRIKEDYIAFFESVLSKRLSYA